MERADALPAVAEIFREHGFEGASLSLISKATGLGKGSLYNFFPGGKEEMMGAVLATIDAWFDTAIFTPLEKTRHPSRAITRMMRDVDIYFESGGRVCLVGLLTLAASRDPFAEQVKTYFVHWISALTACLERANIAEPQARTLAEEVVAGIQGAIILTRALDDNRIFKRIMGHNEAYLLNAIKSHL